jgi:5-methylcytosine-specific restriction enzyme subunit McrC
MVGLGSYRRGALPEVGYTRLDEHYRPAVELARLIIENSSLELLRGEVAGAAFFIDMNKVFERFLYVALGEALGLPQSQWRQGAGLTLDEGGHILMKPDLSWWPTGTAGDGSRPIFVGDAKYKKPETQGFEHADIYQMLAYCTAADLPSGLLVYAAGEDKPGEYKIKHAGKTIEVASLNLEGTPEAILREVRRLAHRVKAHASQEVLSVTR